MSAPVFADADFHRIASLPHRIWTTEQVEQVRQILTSRYRTPDGALELWAVQAQALADVYAAGGGLIGAGVGHGKTLISMLAPVLMQSERPLLFVPASKVAEAKRDFASLSQHWQLRDITILSYDALSQTKNATLLDRLAPDLIIADECQSFKAPARIRTKRFIRYMRSRPSTRFVGLSGTITRKTIKDFAHLLHLGLGDAAPVPKRWPTLQMWADALDADVPVWVRPSPGCLPDLIPDSTGLRDLDHARESFRQRLALTQGVTLTADASIGISLEINHVYPDVPSEVSEALAQLLDTWCTPAGDELMHAVEVWRHARELACGFYYRWEPRPPSDWLEARAEWHRVVRRIISSGQLDSPLQVARSYPEHPAFLAWKAIEDTYQYRNVPKFLSKFLVPIVRDWIAEHQGPVWVEHTAIGDMLQGELETPYFGGGAKASTMILDHVGPCIASIAAHGTGKNLQWYHRALVVSAPPSGSSWEQLLGRLHRPGQRADKVVYDVLMHTPAMQDAWSTALEDARYMQSTTGQPQRILTASGRRE